MRPVPMRSSNARPPPGKLGQNVHRWVHDTRYGHVRRRLVVPRRDRFSEVTILMTDRQGHNRAGRPQVAGVGLIIPSAIDPGRAQRARPHGSRSFVHWALHLDPWGLARSLTGGSTADGFVLNYTRGLPLPPYVRTPSEPRISMFETRQGLKRALLGIHDRVSWAARTTRRGVGAQHSPRRNLAMQACRAISTAGRRTLPRPNLRYRDSLHCRVRP